MLSQLELSSSQQDAVEAPWKGTINMVLSTAGSGKTLTLTRRAVKIAGDLVNENRFYTRLLCVCFNKSAAEEMWERLKEELHYKNLSDRVYVTKNASSVIGMVTIEVRTFHALGLWALTTASPQERQTIGFRAGRLKLISSKDHFELVQAALVEAGAVDPNMSQKQLEALAKKFEERKRKQSDMECQARFESNEDIPSQSRVHIASRLFEMYEQRMRAQNSISPVDMICKSIKLGMENEQVRNRLNSRFMAVLVDEFQDMSPSDFTLCRFFVEKSRSLTVVGDDDQRIYSFRCSEGWFCHEVIETSFSGAVKVFALPENRRCPGPVVKSANAVIRRNSRRVAKNLSAVRRDGTPVRIVGCKTQELEIYFVERRIKSLLKKVEGSSDQILVLFRINALLEQFEKSFGSADIETSRMIGDSSKAENIGSKSLATFALISLMSKSVDKETFAWAAATVSPGLERQAIGIFLDGESDTSPEPYSSHPSTKDEDVDQEILNHRQSLPYPSPLIERVRLCFQSGNSGPLEVLLAACDRLLLEIRTVRSMVDVLKSAEAILSSEVGSQEQVSEPSDLDETKAGFDLLIEAATEADEQSRSQKRRKIQGLSMLPNGQLSIPQQREQLGQKIQEFCQALNTTIMTSIRDDWKPAARSSSHPRTVLSTIHKAKGAQFPYVFLCGADKYNIPNGSGHKLKMGRSIDLQSPHVEEERRMFFVSLTRTQKEFTCTYHIPEERPTDHPRSMQSPFLEELAAGTEGDNDCVIESFIQRRSDVGEVLQTFH